jgi:C_GCAxxG_C_C family probable redox protein
LLIMTTGPTPEQAKAEALARFNDPGPDHINCAQAVVCFALLTLGHDPGLLTTARYFGGGVAGMGETCGAITGAALALGLRDMLLTDEAPVDLAPITRAYLQELLRDFTLEFGARRCNDLTGIDISTPEGHDAFMASEARGRCKDYVGWMCDQIAPLLLDPDAA